jgi:signal transduction histidine kinase
MTDPFTFHPQDTHLLDIFAHDLRSPLLGMQGCLGEIERALSEQPDCTPFLEDLGDVKDGLARVEELLTGLLTICRRSRPTLQLQRLDMAAVCADAIAQVEQARGPLSITLSHLPDCTADRAMLTEALVHLLDNAARAGGPITIDGEAGARITYRITDSGSGMSASIRRRAFGLFSSDTDGEGIGLSLARHLIILHRGWLRLSNTERGCCIEVSMRK